MDRIEEYQALLEAACARVGAKLESRADYKARTGVVSENAGEVVYRLQGPIDDIFGFDTREVITDLDRVKPVSLRMLIDSPGGFMSDAQALYTDIIARIKGGMKFVTEARGVVASAATLIYLAAEERLVTSGSQLMVHAPWAGLFVIGSKADIEKRTQAVINGLVSAEKVYGDVLKSQIKGATQAKIDKWLATDTWFTDSEALDEGLATSKVDSEDASAASMQASARRVLQGIAGRAHFVA